MALELGNGQRPEEFQNRKSLDCLKQTVSRNRYVKDSASEGSEKKKMRNMLLETRRKRILAIQCQEAQVNFVLQLCGKLTLNYKLQA